MLYRYYVGFAVESLDAQIGPHRSAHISAMRARDYDLANYFMEAMHSCLPPKARIEDYESFKPKSRYQSDQKNELFLHCQKWINLIETAITIHREKLLNSD